MDASASTTSSSFASASSSSSASVPATSSASSAPAVRRVLVFGATGATGALVVRLLLAQPERFAVTAFVRPRRAGAPPRTLPFDAAAVRLVEAGTDDEAAVAAAVAESDVVVNTLGHFYGETDASFMTRLITRVLAAMRASGGRCARLVDVSGVACPEPGDGSVLVFSFMNVYLRVLKNSVMLDHAAKTAAIKAAAAGWQELNWTIARPVMLTNSAASGYRAVAAADASCSSLVSRADVARFIVDELEQPRWPRAAPVVCGTGFL